MNIYYNYKCNTNKTWDNPGTCKSLVRADRWTQLLSLEGGGAKWPAVALPLRSSVQREFWRAHRDDCRAAKPPMARHLQAKFPEEDTRDLKPLLRADKLKMDGITVINPADALQHLPQVEPSATGTVFKKYSEQKQWEGHWALASNVTWEKIPEFN
eukprot:1556774-Pyramimonas_sp.AAC.1